MKEKKIIILGNGIAGVTAARNIRKLNQHHSIIIISDETSHFIARPALMYVFMGQLSLPHLKPYSDDFWKKNKLQLVHDTVTSLHVVNQTLSLQSGKTLSYDLLILATGSKPLSMGWPGEKATGVHRFYHVQDLRHIEESSRHVQEAILVGGGLIGVELAEMLWSKNIKVTFLIREKAFWNNAIPIQESNLITQHIRHLGITIRTETEIKEILSDESGKVKGLVTQNGETIPCEFLGITIGVTPNIDLVRDCGIKIEKGILVNEYLQTNIENIYAIGDCAQLINPPKNRQPIEPVWYVGKIMGETVAQTLCNNPKPYQPGPWFNSAKFFNLEYQTYGTVNPLLGPESMEFYWEHPTLEKCLRLVWNKTSLRFEGINALGFRLRHETFDRWLKEEKDVVFIITHLAEANFDPEFSRRYEKDIQQVFHKTFPELKKSLTLTDLS